MKELPAIRSDETDVNVEENPGESHSLCTATATDVYEVYMQTKIIHQ
jgi:hypothetical protein